MEVEKSIRAAIEEILPQVAAEGMAFFQKEIASKKLVFTEQLVREFELSIQKEADSVSAEIRFEAYGRFKDMKYINRHKTTNIEALEKFIEEVGLSNFAWIPGYENSGHVPADSIAKRRLAWTIASSFTKVGIIERKYSGTWYNQTKMRMVNVARRRILNRAVEILANGIAGGLTT
jgi:hypothetical protein